MKYQLIDQVIAKDLDAPKPTLTAVKALAASEEYLQDHFATFPVMPGVLMIEAALQACRALANELALPHADRLVLAEAAALKFGSFVAPGDTLRVTITLTPSKDPNDQQQLSFKAEATVTRPTGHTDKAFAGKLTLRPPRT